MSKYVVFMVLALCALATASPLISPLEELCGAEGLIGGYSKANITDPTSQEVFEAVADEFITANNATITCDDFVVEPLQACSQVVAGTNYEVLLHITCPATDESVTVYGTAFVPLPSSGTQTVIVDEVQQVPE